MNTLVFSARKKSLSTPESRRGDRVHEVLSRLDVYPDTAGLAAALRAAAQGLLPEDGVEALAAFLSTPGAARFFTGDIRAQREIDVAAPEEGRVRVLRLDRLVVAADTAWIIDFKTGSEYAEEHRRQVAEYMRVVGPLVPKLRVRGALLYTDLGRVEEVE